MAKVLNFFPAPVREPVDAEGKRLNVGWLRWFQTLQNVVASLVGDHGTQYLDGCFGQFLSTTTQTLAGTATPTKIALDASPQANGVTMASNKVTVSVAGTYAVSLAAQLTNSDASAQDATLWIRKNATDVANTAQSCTVPAIHGGVNGALMQGNTVLLTLAASDYLEFYWLAGSTAVQLAFTAASGVPVVPAIPSFSATLVLISA